MCRSTNRPSRGTKPEIWFRILHVAADGHNPVSGALVPEYRDQTVEITLGPDGAFEGGNVGAVTRRVAAERVVNAAPRRRAKPNRLREPQTPRVVELLREAMEWQALLGSGEVPNQAAIARREGITRARVTQIMGLLRLTPEIQERILAMPDVIDQPTINERALRPIARLGVPAAQRSAFLMLLDRETTMSRGGQ